MSDESIYVAASGALVQEARLEVLSNNLANINTIGFKEEKAVFSNYIPGEQSSLATSDPDLYSSSQPEALFPYAQSNMQVQCQGTQTSFEQGQLKQTGNALDFAINGKGFFCVEVSEGVINYTRKGTFRLDEEKLLVTQEGAIVLDKNGNKISLNEKNIFVDEKGNISSGGIQVGTLKVVDFDNLNSLQKQGDTLFEPIDSNVTEIETDEYQLMQGFTEQSNVNPIKIMTEMIEVHRAFEAYQKIIKSLDETVARSLNEIGSSSSY